MLYITPLFVPYRPLLFLPCRSLFFLLYTELSSSFCHTDLLSIPFFFSLQISLIFFHTEVPYSFIKSLIFTMQISLLSAISDLFFFIQIPLIFSIKIYFSIQSSLYRKILFFWTISKVCCLEWISAFFVSMEFKIVFYFAAEKQENFWAQPLEWSTRIKLYSLEKWKGSLRYDSDSSVQVHVQGQLVSRHLCSLLLVPSSLNCYLRTGFTRKVVGNIRMLAILNLGKRTRLCLHAMLFLFCMW